MNSYVYHWKCLFPVYKYKDDNKFWGFGDLYDNNQDVISHKEFFEYWAAEL